MAKIGWIGTGNMGSPMSQNLVKAGHEVVVVDKIKSKADAVIAAGAKWVDTPKAAAETSEYVFTMIPDGIVLYDVSFGSNGLVAGLSPGKIVIDMSTISVDESAKVNEAIEKAGCKFLRAPVTGSTKNAQNIELGVLASGDKAAYDKALPLFRIMGQNQFYLGGGEEARIMKVLLNLMVATTMQMEAEAVVTAEKAGLDVRQVCEIIAGSSVGSPLTGYKIDTISSGDFSKVAFSVKLMLKDVGLALAVAERYGVKLKSTLITKSCLDLAESKGYGDMDFSVLTRVLEEESGYKR